MSRFGFGRGGFFGGGGGPQGFYHPMGGQQSPFGQHAGAQSQGQGGAPSGPYDPNADPGAGKTGIAWFFAELLGFLMHPIDTMKRLLGSNDQTQTPPAQPAAVPPPPEPHGPTSSLDNPMKLAEAFKPLQTLVAQSTGPQPIDTTINGQHYRIEHPLELKQAFKDAGLDKPINGVEDVFKTTLILAKVEGGYKDIELNPSTPKATMHNLERFADFLEQQPDKAEALGLGRMSPEQITSMRSIIKSGQETLASLPSHETQNIPVSGADAARWRSEMDALDGVIKIVGITQGARNDIDAELANPNRGIQPATLKAVRDLLSQDKEVSGILKQFGVDPGTLLADMKTHLVTGGEAAVQPTSADPTNTAAVVPPPHPPLQH